MHSDPKKLENPQACLKTGVKCKWVDRDTYNPEAAEAQFQVHLSE